MRAPAIIAARSKRASRTHVAEGKGLERRRGLVSFLTWAFFFAEVFGRDGIEPASAHAAEADELRPSHASSDDAPVANNLADRPMTGIVDDGEPTTPVSTDYSFNPQPSGRYDTSLDTGDTGTQDAPVVNTVAHQPISVGDGATFDGPSAEVDAMPMADPIEPAPLIHLTIAPDGLLHGVADTLGDLPLVGNLLGDTVHLVASTVEGVLGGLGGLLSPHASDAGEETLVASGGYIAFEPGAAAAPFHELETPQGFTLYGIELSLPGGSALSHAPSPASDFASESPDYDAAHLSVSSDHASPDDIGQRAAADALA
jgi:hypothetical protein